MCELKRQKEAWAAAEKTRRDTWLAEKTKQVKELTVKVRHHTSQVPCMLSLHMSLHTACVWCVSAPKWYFPVVLPSSLWQLSIADAQT